MKNSVVSVRSCPGYDLDAIIRSVQEIYTQAGGPSLKDKTVLLKVNILSDHNPERAISTHPVFLEAVIKFAQTQGAAKIMVGDSPAIHAPNFQPHKCGIFQTCTKTGAEWQYFAQDPINTTVGNHKIKMARAYHEADLIISLPKLKTHGLMLFTGAIKNTFGFLPAMHKAKQHALFNTQKKFADFLLDLNDTLPAQFYLMDGITAMEGPGPSNGFPIHLGAILGSVNPLALDLIAAGFCGYTPQEVPTNQIGLQRGTLLKTPEDILYQGPPKEQFTLPNFRKIYIGGIKNIAVRFLLNRLPAIKRLERRPIFNPQRCIACKSCIKLCPAQVLTQDKNNPRRILIHDKDCIRCFCCHEICPENAIDIKRKWF